MDRVDRQILHCLKFDARASFRTLGTVVGVSEQTAARRYRALREAGVVRVAGVPGRREGAALWFAQVHCRPGYGTAIAEGIARHAGVSWVSLTAGASKVICAIETPETVDGTTLLDRLPHAAHVLRFEAVAALHLHAGGPAEWHAFDDALTDEQLTQVYRSDDTGVPETSTATDAAKGTAVITREDQALLTALADDGRASIAALADVTGWTAARASRRLHELLSGGGIRIEADLDTRALGFHASAFLWLSVAPGHLHEVGSALSTRPETGFTAATTGTTNLMAAITCRNNEGLYDYLTTVVGDVTPIRSVGVDLITRRIKQSVLA